jgi:uncharacterized DUF497 family protein
MIKDDEEMDRTIKMTAHAKERALHRGVDQTDIERIINSPTETIYDEYEENYKSYGLANDPYTKEDRYLVIFHTILNKYVKIISVMWTDKGGLQRHGFSKL